MNNNLSKTDLLAQLEQQYRILAPVAVDANGTFAALQGAYSDIRDEFAQVINKDQVLEKDNSVEHLCKQLSKAQTMMLGKNTTSDAVEQLDTKQKSELRKIIKAARIRSHRKLQDSFQLQGTPVEKSLGEKINVARSFFNLEPNALPKTTDERLAEIPESMLNAYKYLVEELGLPPEVLTHLLCLLNPDQFSYNAQTIDCVSQFVGTCEYRVEPALPNLPPEIFVAPQLGWFRKIFFNELRDKYLPIYNQSGGLETVCGQLEEEIELISDKEKEVIKGKRGDARKSIQHEFAVKRRFLYALRQYFEEIDAIKTPTRLKDHLSEDEDFPNKYQKAALFETKILGKYFNATEMGGGKTGYAISFIEHLREQRLESGPPPKTVVICPANIVGTWQERLANGPKGYFKEGQEPNVVVLNGSAKKRSDKWEEAKEADYVVIGIEMSGSSTDAISHEQLLKELNPVAVIFDEVHNLSNTDEKETSHTERIYRISQSPSIEYKILLSGTPIPNRRKDIAAQLRLLHATPENAELKPEQSIATFEAFIEHAPISTKDASVIAKGDPLAKTSSYEMTGVNFHDIRQLVSIVENCDDPITQHFLLPYLFMANTKDCLPVEAELKPTINDYYEITPAERCEYDDLRMSEGMGMLSKVHKMHQALLNTSRKDRQGNTLSSKFKRLTHWIDTFLEEDNHNGKIVVTSPHYKQGVTRGSSSVYQELKKQYEPDIPIFILDGDNSGHGALKHADTDGSPLTKSRRIIAQFRDYPGPAILLTQMDTVREGIDLSFASRAIMLSPDWTKPAEEQFWRRLFRRGQISDVQCVKLIAQDTIEEGLHFLAEQKHFIGTQLLFGRKLFEEEMQLLEAGTSGKRANPYRWWTDMSNKEKLTMLWGKMKDRGKHFVKRSMSSLGSLIAYLYNKDWETSYNGNGARLVSAVINRLQEKELLSKKRLEIADIASGAFAIARTMQHKPGITVHSSDINPAVLHSTLGNKILGDHFDTNHTQEAAMDDLPYENESKDAAVLSLGLHYGLHKEEPAFDGKERIRTLLELHRILKPNGIGVITLPPSLFRGRMQEKFQELCIALRLFGFEIVESLSDRVRSKQNIDGVKRFEIYVFTIQKISEPEFSAGTPWNDIPEFVRTGLDFSKVKKSSGRASRPQARVPREKKTKKENVYYDTFTFGKDDEAELTFAGSKEQDVFKQQVHHHQTLLANATATVQTLMLQYQRLEDVPAEQWATIDEAEILENAQELQDIYFAALKSDE